MQLIQRIQQKLEADVETQKILGKPVTLSFGVSQLLSGARTVEELLESKASADLEQVFLRLVGR